MKRVLIALYLFSSFCYGQQNNITIKANVRGIGDTIFIWKYRMANTGKPVADTIIAIEDTFTYTSVISEPTLVLLLPKKSFIDRVDGTTYMPPGRYMEAFLSPNDSVQLTGNLEPYYLNYFAKGSQINEAHTALRENYKTLEIETAKIEMRIDSLSKFLDTKEEIDQLYSDRKKRTAGITAIQTSYINSHLSSDISAFYLSKFSHEEFARYYPKLTDSVRAGFFKNLLDRRYEAYRKSKVIKTNEEKTSSGEPALDFSVNDIHQQKFSLSALKGKVIILDFWGTWCGPCIREIPELKALTERLKEKISVVGIACKDKKEDVLRTVKDRGITWPQLVNSVENDLSLLYGVQAFPTKIIIDKDLRIVGRFVGLDTAFYTTIDKLTN